MAGHIYNSKYKAAGKIQTLKKRLIKGNPNCKICGSLLLFICAVCLCKGIGNEMVVLLLFVLCKGTGKENETEEMIDTICKDCSNGTYGMFIAWTGLIPPLW